MQIENYYQKKMWGERERERELIISKNNKRKI